MNILELCCGLFLLIQCIGAQCPVSINGVHSYGDMCQYRCRCQGNVQCSQAEGDCPSGCAPGWMGPACQYVNLAFEKPTNQSSTYPEELNQFESTRAVDGDSDTCSKTLALEEAWWGVDLGEVRYIVGLVLTTPLGADLDSFTIAVSNDSFENTSSYMTCYEETGATNGASVSQEITCLQPVWGRYLVIRKLENNSEVQVCEVQIYGGRELAFRKPTTQSSTLRHNTGAKEANDGSLADNDVSHCSMTRLTDEPWWLVDLEQTYSIQRVVIHNMALTGTQDLMRGFWMWIRKQHGVYGVNAYLYIHQDTTVSQTVEVILNQPFEGRYVEILLPAEARQLALCEVEVFGDCAANTCGKDCSKPCWCNTTITGDTRISGICPYGCSERILIPTMGCEFGCDKEHWGQNCMNSCGKCADDLACDVATGMCETGCADGFIEPPMCAAGCEQGLYGDSCDQPCGNCLGNKSCDHKTGACFGGCEAGFLDPLCTEECTNNTWGINCNMSCGQCKDGDQCNAIIGYCEDGCKDGHKEPPFCTDGCMDGYYGDKCELCGDCYGAAICDIDTGHCDSCAIGYQPPLCQSTCNNGRYGFHCKQRCGRCRDNEQCDVFSGLCPSGCQLGWTSDNCTIYVPVEVTNSSASTSDETNKQRRLMGIVLGTVGGVLLICLILFGYLNYVHRRRRSETIASDKDKDVELYDHKTHEYDEKATKC